MFLEWLSGTEPLPHTVSPRCVCSVLRARAQFCWFDKADATANIQSHCNHRLPLSSSELTGCGYPGLLDQKCVPGGSRTLDFLRAKQAPYPQGQALCSVAFFTFIVAFITHLDYHISSVIRHVFSLPKTIPKNLDFLDHFRRGGGPIPKQKV